MNKLSDPLAVRAGHDGVTAQTILAQALSPCPIKRRSICAALGIAQSVKIDDGAKRKRPTRRGELRAADRRVDQGSA